MKNLICYICFIFTFTLNAQHPVTVDPIGAREDVPVKIVFAWKHVATGEAYRLEIDTTTYFNSSLKRSIYTDNSYGQPVNLIGTGNNVFLMDSTYLYNTKYFWRIKTIFASDSSVWSSAETFKTRNTPDIIYPLNNAFAFPQSFQVAHISGSTAYHLQINTDPIFTNPIYNHITFTDLHGQPDYQQIQVPGTNYQIGLDYYWRIRSISDVDTSSWSDTLKFTASNSNGVQELNDLIKIYPNPISHLLHIINMGDAIDIEMIDVQGKSMGKWNISNSSTIDVSNLPTGMYYLKYFSSNCCLEIKKIIITR